MDIEEYRSQVEMLLLQAVAEGKTKLTESEVLTMLADFSDDELAEGMIFNDPADVAETILTSEAF